MIRLWGRTNSSNVMKVLWLLDELALSFERIDAGGSFGRVDTPQYRAMNPYGLVPVIEDGPVILFESNTILRYVCAAHAPGTAFYPPEPGVRGRVESWMDAQLSTMGPLGVAFRQLIRIAPEQRDEAALSEALEQTADRLAVLDTALAGRPYLTGDELTLADMAFGPHVHRWFALPLARPDMRSLRAYYRRLLERPAYVARCAGALS